MNNESVVIGYGTVGRAIANAFNINNYYSRGESNVSFEDLLKFKYIHICLPTPTINGKCYVDDITELFRKFKAMVPLRGHVFIIHSTVYAGYNKFLQEEFTIKNIVSNPEFLSEETAIEDANNPALIVIGADDPKYREVVKGIYTARFRYCEPVMTDSITAELIKLSLNAFFTTKVVFANTIFDYAQSVGANYEVIKRVLEYHPWGSKGHFNVYHKKGRGAGGKCLPKDMEALQHASKSSLFEIIRTLNYIYLRESGKIQ